MIFVISSIQDKPVHEGYDEWEGGDASIEHGEHSPVPEGIARDLEDAFSHFNEVVAALLLL